MGALRKHVEQVQPSKLVVCTPEELHQRLVAAVEEVLGRREQAEQVPEYLTTQQVAEMLQTSTRSVRYLIARRQLRATRIGDREWRFKRTDVVQYMQQHDEGAKAE